MIRITTHGQSLRAYRCKICGALDTDFDRLLQHERKHAEVKAEIRAAAGFKPAKKKRGRPPKSDAED